MTFSVFNLDHDMTDRAKQMTQNGPGEEEWPWTVIISTSAIVFLTSVYFFIQRKALLRIMLIQGVPKIYR